MRSSGATIVASLGWRDVAGSVVVKVRRWLVESIAELPGMEGVRCEYFVVDPSKMGAAFVTTGPAEVVEVAPSGHRAAKYRRRETIQVPLVVDVLGAGMDQQAADERCLELFTIIDDWLADTDNVQAAGADLGVNQQVIEARIVSWGQGVGSPERGNPASIVATVQVVAESL